MKIETAYICPICGKQYRTRIDVIYHIEDEEDYVFRTYTYSNTGLIPSKVYSRYEDAFNACADDRLIELERIN